MNIGKVGDWFWVDIYFEGPKHTLISCGFWKWYFKLKPTRLELFSERNGYVRVYRFKGISLIIDRRRDR